MGHYRCEPTLFDESILPLLEPPTTLVDPPPVTVNIRFPIAPAPVPFGLAAAPVLLPAPTVATVPALLVPDTADVAAEPQIPQRPTLPTQDIRFTDDNNFQNNELPNFIPSTSTSESPKLFFNNNDLQLQNQAAVFEPKVPLLEPQS